MKDLYCVMGNPISHSKSPWIHAEFASQTGQSMEYKSMLVPPESLREYLADFCQQGGKGANITLPFKTQALSYVQHSSERARLAGAVNTIRFEQDGSAYGDNTDGIGLVNDLTKNLYWPITAKRILLIGAGGAVRGVIAPLLAQQPSEIIITNRTMQKAHQLVKKFFDRGNIKAIDLQALKHEQFDLVINGTSAVLQKEPLFLPSTILKAEQARCYDMAYGNAAAPFLKWAKAHHCEFTADGLGMLVEQAAESFYIWRDVRPDTKNVLAKIKEICLT